ncbi:MAG: HDIG domain-containing protein [Deltaproteobacteria bacterium]|nr:HDIG domain-containing protein [Deltaproteobacteria bacterium]
MHLPSKKKCYRLMVEMKMMDHIVAHSLQVCRVATLIVDRLTGLAVPPDCRLVVVASLLHDITKTRSFETGENHASTGGKLLVDLGYPQVGEVIRQHVRLDTYTVLGTVVEAEIVNYADKRVLHDKVVSLDERMAYVCKRYGNTIDAREQLKWLQDKTVTLEQKLFRYLPFSPEDLLKQLNSRTP